MSSFTRVAGIHPGRSFFNLSYSKKFNGDMGKIYPIMCDEVVPGDVWKIGNEFTVRFEPLIAPIMQDMWLKVRYFFVPYRLLKRDCLSTPGDTFDWEEFLSDGVDGKTVTQILPRWIPTNNAKYSLWDYFGFPVGVSPAGAYPLNFPREAYNFIWNEYFRNENLDAEVSLDNENILLVRWNKDYFTSALPWQQRGTAPVLSGDILYLGEDDNYHHVNIVTALDASGYPASYGSASGGAVKFTDDGSTLGDVSVGVVGTHSGAGMLYPKNSHQQIVYGGLSLIHI